MNKILVTISIACFNNCDTTRVCLKFLAENTPSEDVEYILTDNCSTDNTAEVLKKANLLHKTIVTYGRNLGFPTPHNEALKMARGEFFIVLNNDIYLKDKFWLQRVLQPFIDNPKMALVGLKGGYSYLSPQGEGIHGKTLEYIEGSCIVGKTELFRKYGLFAPNYKMFYYEDSDLSLRYRQMGYEIGQVDFIYQHFTNTTLSKIDPTFRFKMIEYNKRIFMGKWQTYLNTRHFNNRILIRLLSDGIGDIICMTPVIEALRRDHPTAELIVHTNHPDVFMNNPHFNGFLNEKVNQKSAFDREITLSPNYGSYQTICKMAEYQACTKVTSLYPQLFPTRMELDKGSRLMNDIRQGEDNRLVVLSTLMARTSWEGRNWSHAQAEKLVDMLNEVGFITVEVGKKVSSTNNAHVDLIDKLTVREFFSFMANLREDDCFVGIDSLGLHVAQAFNIPSYIMFGATEPASRILDFGNTIVIRNEGLACLGCYNRKGQPGYNTCELKYEACMKELSADLVFAYIIGQINGIETNLSYLQNYLQREE